MTATATLELTLSGEKGFVPGSNIITADFGGTGKPESAGQHRDGGTDGK